MIRVRDTTRGDGIDRVSAAITLCLLVASTAACSAGTTKEGHRVSLSHDDTLIQPIYQAAVEYNKRLVRPHRHSPAPVTKQPVPRDLVFVIDASGSMIGTLPFVINETKRVVNEIRPEMAVTLICFSGRGVYEVDSAVGWSGPRLCTPAYKAEIRDWLTLSNHRFKKGGWGGAYLDHAMVRALRYEPDLIFLISDDLTGGGIGAIQPEINQADLLALIHEYNTAKPPTKINTLQFLQVDPLVHQGMQGTLRRIADETGGRHRFISDRDLNLR